MILRNGKIIRKSEDIILEKCVEKLPQELLLKISEFHHCLDCFKNKQIHCSVCNECNINIYHTTCDICKMCYSKYKTRIFNNMHYRCQYYFCSRCRQN